MNRMAILGDERMERMRRERGSPDYRAATGVMRDILVKVIHETYEPQLQALQSPVTLLWGSADREVPVDVANRAAELISNAGGKVDVEILEGIGHLVPVQAPDSLRRAIDRALAG
jgi:pimeloyl-ACP methyl ester carboxylesterase